MQKMSTFLGLKGPLSHTDPNVLQTLTGSMQLSCPLQFLPVFMV